MLANRTFGLLALCLLTLTSTAAAVGLAPPATPPLPVAAPSVPAAPGIATPALPGDAIEASASANALLPNADTQLLVAEGLLAKAHAQAQIAARQAHAAENARMRFFRIADHAIANANVETGAAQTSPERVPERLLAHLAFVADHAAAEAERARAEALGFAQQARSIAEARFVAIQAIAADPTGVQPRLLALSERLQGDAQARIQAAQSLEVVAQELQANAQAAVVEWSDRVAVLRADATADPASLAFAQNALAEAEARAELAAAHADALAARAETGAHDALNDPYGAPFRMLERMRMDPALILEPVNEIETP